MTIFTQPVRTMALFLVVALACQAHFAKAGIVFGFSPQPGDYSVESGSFDHRGFLTREGITVSLTGHSDNSLFSILGKINLSNQGIGISIDDAANNNVSLIDLASSDTFGDVNERLLLSFDQPVQLTGISLRGLNDGGQAALILNPESSSDTLSNLDGTSSLIDSYDLSSSNILLAANQKIGVGYVSGGGFQVDSFSVQAVPEPSSLMLCSIAIGSLVLRRKRV